MQPGFYDSEVGSSRETRQIAGVCIFYNDQALPTVSAHLTKWFLSKVSSTQSQFRSVRKRTPNDTADCEFDGNKATNKLPAVRIRNNKILVLYHHHEKKKILTKGSQ